MAAHRIRHDEGASYERFMGGWSRLAGEQFLGWLAPRAGLRWIDIGCGNGAFTELIVGRCAPAEVHGIDPSEAQLAFARARPAARGAVFRQGDALALPFPDGRFDAAAMALVIFFLPDPAEGIREMVRVTRPGGTVATYAWDMPGGGFPAEPIRIELRSMGIALPNPPSFDASRMEVLQELWAGAGLDAVETREITVERSFNDFEDFWASIRLGTSIRLALAKMAPEDVELLKTRLYERVAGSASGRISCSARANAIKGLVPM